MTCFEAVDTCVDIDCVCAEDGKEGHIEVIKGAEMEEVDVEGGYKAETIEEMKIVEFLNELEDEGGDFYRGGTVIVYEEG